MILDGGDVFCWGKNNYGQLGDGTTSNRDTPTITASLGTKAVAIAAGYDHTCAILDNGEVSCWGRNQNGQLGDGNEGIDSTSPISTDTLGTKRDAIAISAGRTILVLSLTTETSLAGEIQVMVLWVTEMVLIIFIHLQHSQTV